jgi:hypothetical protein
MYPLDRPDVDALAYQIRGSYVNVRTDDTDVPEHFWNDNTPRLTERLVEFAKDSTSSSLSTNSTKNCAKAGIMLTS